jgi:hypothetical protein
MFSPTAQMSLLAILFAFLHLGIEVIKTIGGRDAAERAREFKRENSYQPNAIPLSAADAWILFTTP